MFPDEPPLSESHGGERVPVEERPTVRAPVRDEQRRRPPGDARHAGREAITRSLADATAAAQRVIERAQSTRPPGTMGADWDFEEAETRRHSGLRPAAGPDLSQSPRWPPDRRSGTDDDR